MISEGFLKDKCDSSLTTHSVVGGVKKNCKNIGRKPNISIDRQNLFWKDMGDLKSILNKINRLNCPITLDPQNSTFLDVGIWAYYNKRLSVSTIDKHLRYARFMQNHKIPVDFNNPNYKNFRQHMDYREEIEKATPHALRHEWKAMQLFLETYDIPKWPYKPPIAPEHKKRNLPFPDIVREFFYYPYSSDPYETALYQYISYHSFLIGWRVPSEICEMTLSDVIVNSDGTGTITITETKKHRTQRTIVPEHFVLSSQSHKSLKNYIDVWRPRVANQYSGNALYLQPNGKPFTIRHLGHKLSEHGKKVWPYFKPYDCRHWTAVSRLIETKICTGSFEPYTVRNWLGHSKLKTTEIYLQSAEMYYRRYPKSWIHSALRISLKKKIEKWGKHCMDLKNRVSAKIKTLLNFSPVNLIRHGRAHKLFKENFWGELARFWKLCFTSTAAIESFSLKHSGVIV